MVKLYLNLQYYNSDKIVVLLVEINKGGMAMCLCKNTGRGDYDKTTRLEIPKELNLYKERTHISVDTCMVSEILYLWENGIGTYGCCCGHNTQLPMINIREEDLEKVKEMGYIVQTNFCGENNIKRVDAVYPKTINITPMMIEESFDYIKEHMKFKNTK